MHLSKISLALRQWGAGAWSPSSLFAAGEQGAWYDPSDLTTMFQDRAGTTPVTADSQTVGLILDKSKGLVLGSELVTNGDFNNGTTGWLAEGGAVLTTDSGGIRVTNGAAQPSGASQAFATIAGRTYKASVSLLGFGGGASDGQVRVGTFSNDFSLGYVNSSAIAPIIFYFVATGTTSYVSVEGRTTTIGAYGVYDNVSVKEIPGNHAVAPSDAARPLYKTDGTYHWLQFDGVDDSLSTAAIDFTATDKMSSWLGVKKNNSTGSYAISLTQSPPSFDGSFAHYFNNATSDQVYLRGQATAVYRTTEQSGVPNTRVLTDLFNLQTAVQQDQLVTRENGVVIPGLITASTTVPATFANDQLFIASRGGVAAFAACHIYSIIVRGALSTTQEITDTETWVNGKTGAY